MNTNTLHFQQAVKPNRLEQEATPTQIHHPGSRGQVQEPNSIDLNSHILIDINKTQECAGEFAWLNLDYWPPHYH